jgi:hypothetical protein
VNQTQPCLPIFDPRAPREPRKLARAVSKETYNVLADTGALGAACTKVMRSLKAYINRFQQAPTPAELTRWMFVSGVIKRESPNLVSPRLSELAQGKVVRGPDGSRTRVGGHEIELLPVRVCSVTGNRAHPVRPREKGSEEPR